MSVQFLTYLNLIFDSINKNEMILIEAEGYSKHMQLGIPGLIPRGEIGRATEDGILEFDFVIQPAERSRRENLVWDIKTVFNRNELPEKLKGIKVNAAENADIVLLKL